VFFWVAIAQGIPQNTPRLVGGFNPPEKYWSNLIISQVGMKIKNI